jgi:hypothetical protein
MFSTIISQTSPPLAWSIAFARRKPNRTPQDLVDVQFADSNAAIYSTPVVRDVVIVGQP